MNRSHQRHLFPALTAAGTLLLIGCTLSLPAGRGPVQDYAAGTTGEEQEANAQEKTRRPVRRMRTSLSLPYFSFAQSLNPRS
ncbi:MULTISPECIES: hypothetical protein [Stenotrophomonas]|uniref:hypothetical protein n=1 Tax=Stenotrophomonas TaxID=40323 RepID=UPI00070D238D|nr:MULTISPECIES: hypothetical protein [Stenotrophomonas]